MASSPMRVLFQVGKLKFCWAGDRFVHRGLVVWTGSRHVRLLALNDFSDWTSKKLEDD